MLSNFAPGGLWSLWEMQQFFVGQFFSDMQMLYAMRNGLFQEKPDVITDVQASTFERTLKTLHQEALRLSFTAAATEISHALDAITFRKITPLPCYKATALIDSINRHVRYALTAHAFVCIGPDALESCDFLTPETRFPNDVPRWQPKPVAPEIADAFPSAVPDLQAARKCSVTDNHTAAVFHMMRAVEFGVRALAEGVAVPPRPLPLEYREWQNLISDIDSQWKDEIDKKWTKSAELVNARAFFKRIIADMDAFKDDVRNVVMHTRGDYDGPGALSVRNRVDGWFRVLASKCNEHQTRGGLLDRSLFVP